MSRKQRRLESLAENVNKRRPVEKSAPTVLSVWEKILIFGTIALPLLLLVGIGARSSAIKHDTAIRQRVEAWKLKHDLTQAQADELLELELGFHKSSSFFSFERPPSSEEREAHKRAIRSRLMTDAPDH